MRIILWIHLSFCNKGPSRNPLCSNKISDTWCFQRAKNRVVYCAKWRTGGVEPQWLLDEDLGGKDTHRVTMRCLHGSISPHNYDVVWPLSWQTLPPFNTSSPVKAYFYCKLIRFIVMRWQNAMRVPISFCLFLWLRSNLPTLANEGIGW